MRLQHQGTPISRGIPAAVHSPSASFPCSALWPCNTPSINENSCSQASTMMLQKISCMNWMAADFRWNCCSNHMWLLTTRPPKPGGPPPPPGPRWRYLLKALITLPALV